MVYVFDQVILSGSCAENIPLRIHGTGIFTYTFNHQHQANVGTYTIHRSYGYIGMYHYIPDIDIDMVFQVAILVLIDICFHILYTSSNHTISVAFAVSFSE